jgi:hypothetical protein
MATQNYILNRQEEVRKLAEKLVEIRKMPVVELNEEKLLTELTNSEKDLLIDALGYILIKCDEWVKFQEDTDRRAKERVECYHCPTIMERQNGFPVIIDDEGTKALLCADCYNKFIKE